MTLKDRQPSQAPAGRPAELGGKPPSSEAQVHLVYCITALANKH